jgi:hypothetical protein
MAKKILGAVISPLTTLMGINPLFPKKKAAATTTAAAPVAPVKKPAFAPIITPLGGSTPTLAPLRPLGSGSTILSDKLGG